MPLNPERRTALATAAVDVVAGQGLRGLTHRAVDAAAGVPTGTASNYFPRRQDLLDAAAEAAVARLTPVEAPAADGSDGQVVQVLTAFRAALADRDAALAWFDLRLQAARDGGPAHLGDVLAAGTLPGTADDRRRVAAALDGVLLAALTGQATDAQALADAEAVVRAQTAPRRGWLARVGLR